MPKSDFEGRVGDEDRQSDFVGEAPVGEDDLLMEQILENINTTPIGQVLKKIACLPEVRRNKVLDVRRRINKGEYNLNERLNIALDRVLEDLTA
ncbi:MAG: flagellar biosynthesis anti-sigma factor FlgM [Planctomycetota bacterium]|nr:MAG: flagellar biosynthesis anti-sigma factor FlgM [Planctomycetota bacterium]